uniref:Uncharacterized protein n=1 Tax=Anguilla anguilla TaxID=7936 RepID=A0A0E9UFL0_ANGAN
MWYSEGFPVLCCHHLVGVLLARENAENV